jgi:hypothetical protein
MAKKKKKTPRPKAQKKQTPNRTKHEEEQRSKKERERVKQEFDGVGQLINSIQERNKEDFSQAAARIVREATENH